MDIRFASKHMTLTPAIEERLGKPIVAHDTALYWRVFKTLGLAPVGDHGHLLRTL